MSTSSPRPRRRLDSDDRGRVASGSAHAHGTSSSAAPHGELASVTSHASSSRLAANGPSRGYVPLALADALARAGGDTTRALDEVLAERNKFCLEAGKLSGENVRIWNLMGRIRKENEALKTPSRRDASSASAMAAPELTHSVSQASSLGDGAGSTTRAASFDVASTRSSPAGAQQPPASAGAGSSSSGFAQARRSVVRARPSTGDRAVQPSSSSSSLSHDVSAVSSPLRSSGDDRREAVVAPARSGADAQSSIMAQRAAAQRRQPLDEPRAAEEADDFDAVDESVAGDTDGTSDAGAGLGLEPAVDLAERSADEPQVSTPRGGAPPEYRDEPLLATPGQRKGSISAIAARARQGSLSSSRGSISSLSAVPTPVLDSRQLSSAAVHVVGSMLRSNERGREVISFFISVALAPRAAGAPGATWRVEKLYSDVLALDARLKQKHGKAASKRMAGATLPDKMLFRDHAPSKVDQRKAVLESYLQNLLAVELPDKDDICTFLCTDVVPSKPKDAAATTREGFLTKKGQNMGRWVTRLYVLMGAQLDYYETRGGPHLGSINIAGAQIGRQQRSATSEMDENSYRHAFLILEKRPPTVPGEQTQMVRHVLCAESDAERDEWVEVLVRAIAELDRQGRSAERAARSASSTPSVAASAKQPPRQDAPLPPPQRPDQRAVPAPMSPPSHGTIASRRLAQEAAGAGDALRSPEASRKPPASPKAPVTPLAFNPRAALPSRSASQDAGLETPARLSTPPPQPTERHSESAFRAPATARPAISGPMNGTPIPSGYKFGSRDEPLGSVAAPDASSKKDDKKRGFWHRFGGGAAADKTAGAVARPVFGVPLAESIAISHIAEGLELPSVVYRCIEYLEKSNAANEEGIYRLSGSSAVVKALKERFNAEGDVDLLATGEQFYDPHAVAGLLKTFLRELPASVLTRELHLEFMRVNDIVDRRERVNELGALVSILPLANYSLLRTLCSHLIKIIEHADVNKMTMRNVGIVFSPTLGIPAGVFALFLTEFDWVFWTSAEGEPAPRQMEEDIQAPDSTELGSAQFAAPPAVESPAQRRRNNRASWIAGGQVHTGDGDVLPVSPAPMPHAARSNRNSLQYDASEADRLLGPQTRGRLEALDDAADDDALDFAAEDDAESTSAHAADFTEAPLAPAYVPQPHSAGAVPPSPAGSLRAMRSPQRSAHGGIVPSPSLAGFPRSPA